MTFPTRDLNRIIYQGFWNLKQEELKYGTNNVLWQLFSGRRTKISKYGTSREIRDAWQAYPRGRGPNPRGRGHNPQGQGQDQYKNSYYCYLTNITNINN